MYKLNIVRAKKKKKKKRLQSTNSQTLSLKTIINELDMSKTIIQ